MRVGPGGVQLAIGWIHRQRWKDVVLRHVQWSVENEGRRPFRAAIGTARDKNIVEICRLGFLDASLTGGIDVVDVVGERIGDDRPLVVVEGRVACRASLTDDGIAHTVKGQAIVVGALDVNQCAVPRIVVGDPYA